MQANLLVKRYNELKGTFRNPYINVDFEWTDERTGQSFSRRDPLGGFHPELGWVKDAAELLSTRTAMTSQFSIALQKLTLSGHFLTGPTADSKKAAFTSKPGTNVTDDKLLYVLMRWDGEELRNTNMVHPPNYSSTMGGGVTATTAITPELLQSDASLKRKAARSNVARRQIAAFDKIADITAKIGPLLDTISALRPAVESESTQRKSRKLDSDREKVDFELDKARFVLVNPIAFDADEISVAKEIFKLSAAELHLRFCGSNDDHSGAMQPMSALPPAVIAPPALPPAVSAPPALPPAAVEVDEEDLPPPTCSCDKPTGNIVPCYACDDFVCNDCQVLSCLTIGCGCNYDPDFMWLSTEDMYHDLTCLTEHEWNNYPLGFGMRYKGEMIDKYYFFPCPANKRPDVRIYNSVNQFDSSDAPC
jgi:hypothetical protein